MKIDNEREILLAILSTLDQVSEEARERIIRTVSTFLGLNLSNGPRLTASEPRPAVHIATNDRISPSPTVRLSRRRFFFTRSSLRRASSA